MRYVLSICLLASVLGSSIAYSAPPAESHTPRRFTLICKSQKVPRPPIAMWVTDVNLDLLTYYVDTQFGGASEIASDDGNRIIFLRWGRDVHGLPMAAQEAFDRQDGHWYFSVRTDGAATPPDAICTITPPREKFQADVRFTVPR